MDPQANLNEQASISAAITKIFDACPEDGNFTDDQLAKLAAYAVRLSELVIALIQWQSRGGFHPNVHLANDVLRHRGVN